MPGTTDTYLTGNSQSRGVGGLTLHRPTIPAMHLHKGAAHMVGRAVLLALVVFVFVLPLGRLALTSFYRDGALSLEAWRDMLSRPTTWKATGNTLLINLSSTAGALLLGTALAWLVAYTNLRFSGPIQFLAFLPFILPSYSIALAWRLLLSPNGTLAGLLALLPGAPMPPNLYSYGGIVFMQITTAFPPVFLLMVSALQRVPQEMEWAARTSGLNTWQVFLKISLPTIAPSFASAGVLTFLSVVDNFGIPAILGVPAGIQVLPTYIYEQITGVGTSAFSSGAVLSLLLIFLSLLAPLTQRLFFQNNGSMDAVRPQQLVRHSLGRARTAISLLVLVFLLTLSVIPVLSMTGTACKRAMGLPLSTDNFTLDHFSFVLLQNAKSVRALCNSFALATFCTLLCLILGTLLAYRLVRHTSRTSRAIETMIQIPYSVPGIVLSLCMILFWMQPLPGVFPSVYGTWRILLIVYITRFLVVQSRASYSALAGFDPSLEEATRCSGMGPLRSWMRISLPLLLPGILSGSVMVFVGILTELTLSSLLWSSGSETIGTTILSFEQAGSLKYSSALSTIVCILVILLYALSKLPERIKIRKGTGR